MDAAASITKKQPVYTHGLAWHILKLSPSHSNGHLFPSHSIIFDCTGLFLLLSFDKARGQTVSDLSTQSHVACRTWDRDERGLCSTLHQLACARRSQLNFKVLIYLQVNLSKIISQWTVSRSVVIWISARLIIPSNNITRKQRDGIPSTLINGSLQMDWVGFCNYLCNNDWSRLHKICYFI